MKKLFPVAVLGLLCLLLLPQIGCDSDEETTGTDGPCRISITRPLPGEVFYSNDEVKIYWDRSGQAANVKIDLMKAGEAVGEIVRDEENDGYYFWYADNLGQPNGNDFSIRVTAMSDDECMDISPEFALTNISGCNFDFIAPPAYDAEEPLTLTADGSTYMIEWFSAYTTGLVNLRLYHLNDLVGTIAYGVPDSLQQFEWTVDSLHEGSGYNYKIEIVDTKFNSCKKFSPYFDMIDDEICQIMVGYPAGGEVLQIGDIFNIAWTYENVDGALDISLYYGANKLDEIATNVDPLDGGYVWDVWIPEVPEENSAQYYIRIVDNANSVAPCWGRSGLFLITD